VNNNIWIALAIGNSRCHWAWFFDTQLQSSWDTSHIDATRLQKFISGASSIDESRELLPPNLHRAITADCFAIDKIPIYLCSVVPDLTIGWQPLPQVTCIKLADIPLLDLYPTLGIDRALAILGAGENYGYPVLVIDGGTALTITGVDRDRHLVGGAIMPGLKLQLSSLSLGTAALPEITLPSILPLRWSNNTAGAISSGVLHPISSGIRDFILGWVKLFPESKIIFTGGDGNRLFTYLKSTIPADLAELTILDADLLFRGLLAIFIQ
jgi:type III pantothenate kinase